MGQMTLNAVNCVTVHLQKKRAVRLCVLKDVNSDNLLRDIN